MNLSRRDNQDDGDDDGAPSRLFFTEAELRGRGGGRRGFSAAGFFGPEAYSLVGDPSMPGTATASLDQVASIFFSSFIGDQFRLTVELEVASAGQAGVPISATSDFLDTLSLSLFPTDPGLRSIVSIGTSSGIGGFQPIPEPGTLLLLGSGLLGAVGYGWRHARRPRREIEGNGKE